VRGPDMARRSENGEMAGYPTFDRG